MLQAGVQVVVPHPSPRYVYDCRAFSTPPLLLVLLFALIFFTSGGGETYLFVLISLALLIKGLLLDIYFCLLSRSLACTPVVDAALRAPVDLIRSTTGRVSGVVSTGVRQIRSLQRSLHRPRASLTWTTTAARAAAFTSTRRPSARILFSLLPCAV